MAAVQQPLYLDTLANTEIPSGRSSMSGTTVCGSEPATPVVPQDQPKKAKKKANKQQNQQPQQKPKKPAKVDKPFYQTLGDELLRSTRLHLEPVTRPVPKMPPMPNTVPKTSTTTSEKFGYLANNSSDFDIFPQHAPTASSISLTRKSMESNFSGITKIITDSEDPTVKYKVKGAVYSLDNVNSMATTEELVLRYGRMAHMGVRDHSYRFWMNSKRTAVVHFKVLNRVAVLAGDPLCEPERIQDVLSEFGRYCRKAGWKVAVIGGSSHIGDLAKQKGWTCLNFGTERVLNPQTNEVLLGKAGKRIVTQCKQLLDPARGGVSIHTYTPAHGRDYELEESLRNLYDEWRNARNTSGGMQTFVTVFDLFSMNSLMTFLYTKDQSGQVNGFSALRKLGAVDGYHIDPFIQNASAPRGVSDLLIFSSLAFLNAKGCSYLTLGYDPVTELNEIWGLPSILQGTTKKVYRHIFGNLPVGGKEAFHAKWKPDEALSTSCYMVFVGKVANPRYMLAMTHFANISLRRIIASDWHTLVAKKDKKKDLMVVAVTEVETSDSEGCRSIESSETEVQRPKTATTKAPTKPVIPTRPTTAVAVKA